MPQLYKFKILSIDILTVTMKTVENKTTTKPSQLLHGDPDKKTQVERMIRVDHAGEYGAARIYEGQLAILGKRPIGKIIHHMAEQEKRHLDTFDKMIVKRRVRPTVLSPVWHIAGYSLGVLSAAISERAAMACTVAVEEVIEEHYNEQYKKLGDDEQELRNVIDDFRLEEIEHKNIGLNHIATTSADDGNHNKDTTESYPVLARVVKASSRLAIWLSTRI